MTRDTSAYGDPTAVGGKENEQPIPMTTSSIVVGNLESSTRPRVTPTLTVAKREPSPTGVANTLGFRTSRRHKRLRRGAPHLQ